MGEFNINESVRVKWTPAGLAAVEEWHREGLGEMAEGLPVTEADVDADGFTSIQLWQLMQIVGPRLRFGMIEPLFENNAIHLEEDSE